METLNVVRMMDNGSALQPVEVGSPNGHALGEIPLLVQSLLVAVGEDPQREGLARTPERVARALGEILSGYSTDLERLVNGAVFESANREMVLVRNIEFYSLCEHHLLPFFGRAHVAYIPGEKIIGLSKIPRLVEMFSRRLQVQERLTAQIGETLHEILQPAGVAVLVEGSHLCARMRGVRKEEAELVTRFTKGVFEHDAALRQEFLQQVERG